MARRVLAGRARCSPKERSNDRRRARARQIQTGVRRTAATGRRGRKERARISAALAEQRRAIAREVHDGLAQELAFLASQLQQLDAAAVDADLVSELRAASRRALVEARLTVDVLRSEADQPF